MKRTSVTLLLYIFVVSASVLFRGPCTFGIKYVYSRYKTHKSVHLNAPLVSACKFLLTSPQQNRTFVLLR